jgi:hypothetical protein
MMTRKTPRYGKQSQATRSTINPILLGGGALVAVALIAVGFFLFTQPRSPTSVGTAACGNVQQLENEGAGHIGLNEPTPVYKSNPPTSGTHNPISYPAGIFSEPADPTKLVHSLEHGYVVIYYNGLSDDQVRQLENIQRSDGFKVIVAPYPNMPYRVALTAWSNMLTCDGVNEQAIRSFIAQFRGQGPEPFGAVN